MRTRTMVRAAVAIVLTALAAGGPAGGAEFELRQVVSRESPLFPGTGGGMSLGRDGNVYCFGGADHKGYVLRLSRSGTPRFGGVTEYAVTAVAANAAGQVATSNAHFAKSINIYDPAFARVGKAGGFTGNDAVGWDSPGHVEAGAGGDFYVLDQHVNRVLRVAADGKIVRSHPVFADLPATASRSPLRSWRFRVCEARGVFCYDAKDGIRCADGSGKTLWTLQAALAGNVYEGYRGAFDLDDAGVLYVVRGDTPRVEWFDREGKPAGGIDLDGPAAPAAPGAAAGQPVFGDLRVAGDEFIVRLSRSDTELFRVYDRRTGRRRRTVHIEHECLTVRCGSEVWTAGQAVPLSIDFRGPVGAGASPNLRAWLRPLGTVEFGELPIRDGKVTAPAEGGGLYQLRVTAGLYGGESEYQVDCAVEIRQPNSKGTISIFTPLNRRLFPTGTPIPVRVVVRCAKSQEPPPRLDVQLWSPSGEIGWMERIQPVAGQVAELTIPGGLPYAENVWTVTVDRQPAMPGWTIAPLYVAGGRSASGKGVQAVRYGDYQLSFPNVTFWNAPERIERHARLEALLGTTMIVDRLGGGGSGALHLMGRPMRDEALYQRLKADPAGTAPEKAEFENVAQRTISAYGAYGIQQRAILLTMDAGLPIGTGFDNRPPEQLEKDVEKVSAALKEYPAFTGWSWAANWWIEARGSKLAATPAEKEAYEKAYKAAMETGTWDKVLETVSDRWICHAVDAEKRLDAALQRAAPGRVSAMTGPYRQPGILPPLTFANADEVDLHWQAEQIQWPLCNAHNVDFYNRPGKRAWAHPELWNDSGTGEQIVSTTMQLLMRGADGIGQSGSVKAWHSQNNDIRSMGMGSTSAHQQANRLAGYWGTLREGLAIADPLAIPVSTRMLRLELDWKGVGGFYFTRLYEAYNACMHAHRPARFVFAEDAAPDSLTKFKGVLLVSQLVQWDGPLAEALAKAKAAGVAIFSDATTRSELRLGATPLDIEFTRVEKEHHVWNDDSAFPRFRDIMVAHAARLSAAWGRAVPPVAECGNPEVMLTEWQGKDRRVLWVVNNTLPPLDVGQMWRVGLFISSRLPVVEKVRWDVGDWDVYDALAGTRLATGATIEADLRAVPGRIYVARPKGSEAGDETKPRYARFFGLRFRDVAVSHDGKRALLTAANWDRNYVIYDLEKRQVVRQGRLGHHFAYGPSATADGFALQAYDLNTAEGYHLYLLDRDGAVRRRFALYGLPKRGVSWANAKVWQDPINQFAVSPDGSWVASAGDLGLAVWSSDGTRLWSDDWWKTRRKRVVLSAAGAGSLLVLDGCEAAARDPRTGKVQWQHRLGETGRLTAACVSADARTIALASTAEGGRIFMVRDGKPAQTLAVLLDEMALSPDGRWAAAVKGEQVKLLLAEGVLRWTYTGRDLLHRPRFSPDSGQMVVAGENGDYVLLDINQGTARACPALSLPAAAWDSGGKLVVATWDGAIPLPQPSPLRFKGLASDGVLPAKDFLAAENVPTVRMGGWGNAADRPAELTPNLLAQTQALIDARHEPMTHGDPRAWEHKVDLLRDGKADVPEGPWLSWSDINYIDSGWCGPLVVQVDMFRTQVRLTGVTFVEDPRRPESWQRDVLLQYWDASAETWRDGPRLLSDAPTHTHWLERPIEAARFRLASTGGGSWPGANLRWGELVFHGEALGPSHPDAVAGRPVAVLFDEREEELAHMGRHGTERPFAFKYDDAFRGGKCIALNGPGATTANWRPPFGHALPNWDFEIVERPERRGQYRYLQFAWKRLSEQTRGVTLHVGPNHGGGVALAAGEASKVESARTVQVAPAAPPQWTKVRVDLWDLAGRPAGDKPLRVRSMLVGAVGGGAAFDAVLLGRSEKDLDEAERK